ncbi:PIN domain-containing protein [Rhodocyclus tenuis]|uniref:Putative nucleic acid-binding protein n=1 Tax=Rhodocyclus tenuis TaxID=1066 RepID=A0A840GEU6_RHOTE|nr:PIN domain-containing protein [Rhodocyclus tenuis]MBB4249158.1 putative nucleic acid-binding protein [Rhodocyclus tenuis]
MKYGAITLDTSIFDQQGLKLDRGLLKTLEQFNGKPIGLVLSEVVLREVHKHLSKKVGETRAQIERAFHQSAEYLPIAPAKLKEARSNIIPSDSDQDISREKIESFVEGTGAQIIKADDYVDISNLIKRYFQSIPPFAESGKKKNEFPDAIALVSLEAFAEKNKFKLLAVSADGDWVDFGKQSEWIDVIGDLAEGIAEFQPQEAAFNFCEKLGDKLLRGEATNISSSIDSFLSTAVSEIDAYPDADSAFFWDADFIEIEFIDFELLEDEEGRPRLSPVQFQDEEISIALSVRIRGTASCDFSLSVHDSIDKDSVSMGTATKNVEFDFESELLLSATGDFEGDIDEIDVDSIELLSSPRYIEFGSLEPDWWRDQDE